MRLVASALALSLLAAACGPSWPSGAMHAQAPTAAHPGSTVDILPVDLELWAEAGNDVSANDLRAQAESTIANAALDALSKRAYVPGALIDWNGDAAGANVLAPDALEGTVASLARYGTELPDHAPARLPSLQLPARLGAATGADTTLYIGGWSYLAAKHESTAAKVGKDIAIGVLIVATAAVVLALMSKSHDHHDSGVTSHSNGGGVHGTREVTVSRWHGRDDHPIARASAALAVDVGDVAIQAALDPDLHPEYADDEALPHTGGESRLYLQMTLVDNRTGAALWHAHQTFPANAASQAEVTRAARTLLASLPAS